MKVKLTIKTAATEPITSKTTGRKFYAARAEAPDSETEWGSCRWSILSDSPIPAGPGEFVVRSYDAMKGVGNAAPL